MNTQRRRTRRSQEQREELHRRFHAVDSPPADFRREHDLQPAALSLWLRKCTAPPPASISPADLAALQARGPLWKRSRPDHFGRPVGD